MRILHAIEQCDPHATPGTLRLMAAVIRATPEHAHTPVLFGGIPMRDMARAAGLHDYTLIGVPGGRVPTRSRVLRRKGFKPGSFDVVHYWSQGMMTRRVCEDIAHRVPLRLVMEMPTLPDFCFRADDARPDEPGLPAGWRRQAHVGATQPHRHVLTFAPAGADARDGRDGRDGREQFPDQWVHRLPIPTDAPLGPSLPDVDILRARWGEPHDVDNVLLLTDRLDAPDAYTASIAIILAENAAAMSQPRLRLLVHPDQAGRVRACVTANNLGAPHRVVDEPYVLAPWLIAHGCRFAIVTPAASVLSVAWAMAAGLIIVGQRHSASGDWLRDGETALLADSSEPKHLAYRFRQLLDDPERARRIGDNAAAFAREHLSFARFQAALREAYRSAPEHLTAPYASASSGDTRSHD